VFFGILFAPGMLGFLFLKEEREMNNKKGFYGEFGGAFVGCL